MSKHPSKDRASLCLFAYSDGRRCRMPRAADPYLCNYHAGREAEDFARQKIGRNISSAFSGECVSATSLSIALARTLAATAPKQAAIIAYLSQSLMQAVQHFQPRIRSGLGLPSLGLLRPSNSVLAAATSRPAGLPTRIRLQAARNPHRRPRRRKRHVPPTHLRRNRPGQSLPYPDAQPHSPPDPLLVLAQTLTNRES
ncbi:MAG TPA: hypothetical protein VN780_03675 [Candidatus Eisenbacteria bacterium]|nr:hypothetical protein [Candidatus Eisenbacteria bacterium]